MNYKLSISNLFIYMICSLLPFRNVAAQSQKKCLKYNDKLLVNKRWKLIALNGKSIQGSSYTHYLILHKKDRIAESKVGCNSLRNMYALNNKDNLHFFRGTSTLMACPNQELEDMYVNALLQTKRFIIKKQQLFLVGTDNKLLAIFQLVPIENGRSFVGKTFVQDATHSFDSVLGAAPFLRFETSNKAALKIGDVVENMEVYYIDNLITLRSAVHPNLFVFKIITNKILSDEHGNSWIEKIE